MEEVTQMIRPTTTLIEPSLGLDESTDGSYPTIWGLNPVEIHDRYWAARGVQVVRPHDNQKLVKDAELFLLSDENTLAIFHLGQLVDNHGPLPAERVIHLLMQTCEALSEAHDSGLLHRDIKPANIFAAHRGNVFDVVKLLDFGLAKPLTSTTETALPIPTRWLPRRIG